MADGHGHGSEAFQRFAGWGTTRGGARGAWGWVLRWLEVPSSEGGWGMALPRQPWRARAPRPESSGRKHESERAGGRRMERAGGQGSAFLNQRSDVVSERGRGGERGANWDATRHHAPVAGRPFKLFN